MTEAATTAGAQIQPLSRSKMVDMYAGDIAALLADGNHESAERAALAIPHIAVALTDAGLESSNAAYQDWCRKWVQPEFNAAAYEQWCLRSGGCEHGDSGVPFAALRALRLRRRAREVPMPFVRTDSSAGRDTPQAITCALLGAAFRWYEQEGRHHRVVQTNLGRLGVLH
jgi:hypothetical protein